MSTIIGVCGTNFCSLIADKRKVAYNSDLTEYYTSDDNFQKIFKLNTHFLIGAAGIFRKDNLLSPMGNILDTRTLAIHSVNDAIMEYMTKRKESLMPHCTYIVGGVEDGRFMIRTFQYNPTLPDIIVKDYKAQSLGNGKGTFGVTIALPAGLAGREDEYINQIGTAINSSTSHKELTNKCEGIIRDIAEKDATVGRRTQVLSIM